MIFNSYEFFGFLAVTFGVYWFAGRRSCLLQNFVLIAVGFVFYGWTDWRLCLLLMLSSGCAYFTGLWLSERKNKCPVALSLAVNLGVLVLFKYYNFFAESVSALLSFVGVGADLPLLKIILPIGLSFYAFMSISYTIDVFTGGRLQP